MNRIRVWLQYVGDHLYLTEKRAIEIGFTHEGTLFGVPAWLMNPTTDDLLGCPKVPALQLWAMIADWFFEFASNFIYEDESFELPIRVLRELTPKVSP